jgi:hypothetical protein
MLGYGNNGKKNSNEAAGYKCCEKALQALLPAAVQATDLLCTAHVRSSLEF